MSTIRKLFSFLTGILILFWAPPGTPAGAQKIKTLAPEWRTATGGKITGDPAVYGGRALFISEGYAIYSIDPVTGEVLHKQPLRIKPSGTPAVSPDGTLYLFSKEGNLSAINGRGDTIWSLAPSEPLIETVSVDRRGCLYVATQAGNMYALTHTGRIRWYKEVSGSFTSTPLIHRRKDLIYIAEGKTLFRIVPTGKRLDPNIVLSKSGETISVLEVSPGTLALVQRQKVIMIDTEGNTEGGSSYYPGGFTASGGWTEGDGTFGVYSKSGEVHLFSITEGNPRLIDSFRLEIEGSVTGIGACGGYLLAGCDSWITYGFRIDGEGGSSGSRSTGSTGCYADTVSSSGVQPQWQQEQMSHPDCIIMAELAGSSRRSSKEQFFKFLDRAFEERALGGNDLCALRFLNELLEGKSYAGMTRRPDTMGGDADLRVEAALRMGTIGNLETRDRLLRILEKEHNEDVRKAIIHALGMLQSDADKKASAIVSRLLMPKVRLGRGAGLASEALFLFASARRYHGTYVSAEINSLLYAVFRADYPKWMRETALRLLEGR